MSRDILPCPLRLAFGSTSPKFLVHTTSDWVEVQGIDCFRAGIHFDLQRSGHAVEALTVPIIAPIRQLEVAFLLPIFIQVGFLELSSASDKCLHIIHENFGADYLSK